MTQSASPDPPQGLGAGGWPSPAPAAEQQTRSTARWWMTRVCLTLAVLLAPATQLERAPGTLASPLVDLAQSQVGAAVPAVLGSPAFLCRWRTALAATHHQLLLVLRDRSHLLTITGSALAVYVPVAAGTLIKAIGLPRQLQHLLPAAIPVSVTILDSPALGQARTAVHLTDILSRILLPATVALAMADLAAANHRRRALLGFLIPVTALGVLGVLAVRLLTRTDSPLVTGAAGAAPPQRTASRQPVTAAG